MSNYMSYTMFFGYRVDEKLGYVLELEKQPECFDGVPEYSLNLEYVRIGYKKVQDNLGKEELYFGVALYDYDEYNESVGYAICYDSLKDIFLKDIDSTYFKFFNERPCGNPMIYIISECL